MTYYEKTSPFTYTEYVSKLNSASLRDYMIKLENALNTGQITDSEFCATVEGLSGRACKPVYAKDGSVLSHEVSRTYTTTTTNAVNSNASQVARGIVKSPVSTTVNSAGKVVTSRLAGVGSKILTTGLRVAPWVGAASIGITLGKTIAETLYNSNPDFFSNNGIADFNPQHWANIVGGSDTIQGQFFNALLGIDPETNESTMYMDANALAYMASYFASMGLFDAEVNHFVDDTTGLTGLNEYWSMPVYATQNFFEYVNERGNGYRVTGDGITFLYYKETNSQYRNVGFLSKTSGKTVQRNQIYNGQVLAPQTMNVNMTRTVKGVTFYFGSFATTTEIENYASLPMNSFVTGGGASAFTSMLYVALYGYTTSPYDGISNQPNATIPQNLTGNPDTDLGLLQNQYPDLFNNAINYPVVQPDGSVKDYVYVPVTLPDTSSNANTQPTSGNQTQSNTNISPDTSPTTIIEYLTKTLQQPDTVPETQPYTDDVQPPANPTDTNSGSSTAITAPTGSASALWSVYHPTQSEIDSFGGWLWSSAFVDQLLKLFNDPMQSIIGLHKIYATPVDAGTSTIHVGYLDSEVSSAYITQQYVEVDCGSVNLSEIFGNVLDYAPYTRVSLYLPFIGIVPLDVNEVMRGEMSITYGVDVFTGACLAMVEVSRDLESAILYQYAGNCATQIPVSSGSYMGIVSGILSVAGGIAATVATGGGAAPIALGVAGAAFSSHTDVSRSGSFSGNSGAMGGKIPYLIISRPMSLIAENVDEMSGYPANAYTTVGECTGYIECEVSHVIDISATSEEIDEISAYLSSGIII